MQSSIDYALQVCNSWGMKPTVLFHGRTLTEASRMTGFDRATLWRWVTGAARMTAESALVVNAALGIPLHVLRPDIWRAPEEAKHEMDARE